MKSRLVVWSLVTDVVGIVVFVAIGRRNHDEGVAAVGIFDTATPFLIALVVGWLVARAWRQPTSTTTGTMVWVTTIIVGMLVRKFLFDDGTATAFVIVATVFLGAVLNGWRLVARMRRDRLTTSS